MAAASAGIPSPWVRDATRQLAAPGSGKGERRVLDLACGGGRHVRMLLRQGHRVLGVDRNVAGLADLAAHKRLEILQWNLEDGRPWPFARERFKAVLVTNYLHRPTLDRTLGLVTPGGLLIYETFGVGNERFGRPSNPDFLARPGEIAGHARRAGFSIAADSHRIVARPRPAVIHRVLARRRTDEGVPGSSHHSSIES